MTKAEQILEPYFRRIETGAPPTAGELIDTWSDLIDSDPAGVETMCIISILTEMYPSEFKAATYAKLKSLGLPIPPELNPHY